MPSLTPLNAEPAGAPSGSVTAASRLARVLRRDIVEGRLAPGMALRLKDLALGYGVGVIPLREALSRLTAVGLVVASDQKGFRVAPLSRQDLVDVTRARQHLETIALKDALALLNEGWRTNLVAAHCRLISTPMTAPLRDGMNPDWENAHAAFHQALLSGCGSDYLIRFTDILRDQTARYRHLSLKGSYWGKRDVGAEHQAIMSAVLSHDAVTACRLLVDHYQKTADLLLKYQAGAFEVPVQPKARPRGRARPAQPAGDK